MRVDFYIIDSPDSQQRWQFACRLIEKVLAKGHTIWVNTQDTNASAAFDELLWTFRPDSFVPHECLTSHSNSVPYSATSEGQQTTPVLISHEANPLASHRQVLVNLAPDIPDCFQQFDRVCEIVVQDQHVQQQRQHFRRYRERGCNVQSHSI